jgi:hypothetical protein
MTRLPLLTATLLVVAMGATGRAGAASAWSVTPTPSPRLASRAVLSSVSCPAPRKCVAVGYDVDAANTPVPLSERWNGARWVIQPTPALPGATAGFLFGVSCVTPRSCTAVGSVTGTVATAILAERWNGVRWAIQPVPAPVRRVRAAHPTAYLAAVSCPSAGACTAVGYAGNRAGTAGTVLALRWTRTAGWRTQPIPAPRHTGAAFLSGVSCASVTVCTAVGSETTSGGRGAVLAERWTRNHWRSEPIPTPAGSQSVQLTGVSCPTSSSCTAVGYFDTAGIDVMLAERREAARWVIGRARYPHGARSARFAQVSCPTPRSCTAVGLLNGVDGLNAPLAERWTPRGWTVQPTPGPGTATAPADAELSGVSCPRSARCVAVGAVEPLSGGGSALAEADRPVAVSPRLARGGAPSPGGHGRETSPSSWRRPRGPATRSPGPSPATSW